MVVRVIQMQRIFEANALAITTLATMFIPKNVLILQISILRHIYILVLSNTEKKALKSRFFSLYLSQQSWILKFI